MNTYRGYYINRVHTYVSCNIVMSHTCWVLLVQFEYMYKIDYRILVQVGYMLLEQIGIGLQWYIS
jgi:hypothetical protein